ncbi:YdcF family protein [Spongisporangium articulatum]|uniref:YdcF family protein n=1 Tax=Spongisporangium articulatum TaxID=3362603 RepID=A0ABW8AKU4_9ACTN
MTRTPAATIPPELREAVEVLWDYHQMHHELRPTDVGIGLGSHDLSVATRAAELWHQGMFPLIVFTGANAPTTVERFPRGEAVHYREHALSLGVPDDAILVEPRATNTSENITLTRDLLHERGISPETVTLISRPYQQRRAYATCRRVWPEVEPLCTSTSLDLDDYVASIGDANRVINMLVGDTQRIEVYAQRGYAAHQDFTKAATHAFDALVSAGYTNRLLPGVVGLGGR